MSSLPLQIQKFEKELKSKITQKQTANMNEENTILKFFKYFDLDSSGKCNFRDWVKTIEKIGIVFNKISDTQFVFNYYDKDKSGYIDYKSFSNDLFKINVTSQEGVSVENSIKTIIDLLVSKGGRGLLEFYKEFKIHDLNNQKKVGIDDFIKCFTNHSINIPIYDIQRIYNSYEQKQNGYFNYESLFKDIKNYYWNQSRQNLISNFSISKNISEINDLIGSYIGEEKELFSDFIESFLFISNLNKQKSMFVTKHDEMVDFFKFFSFGVEDDNQIESFLENKFVVIEKSLEKDKKEMIDKDKNDEKNNLLKKNNFLGKTFNDVSFKASNENESKNKENKLRRNRSKQGNVDYHRDISNDNTVRNRFQVNNQEKGIEVIEKFKKRLSLLKRKEFISMLKYFKYYDNDTGYVNQTDFTKIVKDYRLNLTPTDINTLFECFSERKHLLNHKSLFFNYLLRDLPKEIDTKVNEIFNQISNMNPTVSFSDMLQYFNAKKNIYMEDEDLYLKDFIESFEMYHFDFLCLDNEEISRKEFVEFHIISYFLVDDVKKKERFIEGLNCEWDLGFGKGYKERISKSKIIAEGNTNNANYRNNIESKIENLEIGNENLDKESKSSKCFVIDYKQRQEENKEKEKANKKYNIISGESDENTNQTKSNEKTKHQSLLSKPPIEILIYKLRLRGITGLLFFHKEILSYGNIGKIGYNDFSKICDYQKLNLDKMTMNEIFQKFSKDKKYLDTQLLMSKLKEPLSDRNLSIVQDIFNRLDNNQCLRVCLSEIKLRFISNIHLQSSNSSSLNSVSHEFLNAFEIALSIINNCSLIIPASYQVSFDEFANFYEYVQFVLKDKFAFGLKGSFNFDDK